MEKDKLHIAVCKKAQEIAHSNPPIKDYYVGKLVNVDSGGEMGWDVVFRLCNKYGYTNEFLNYIANMLESHDWSVKAVRGAIEISIKVEYKEADIIKLRQELK